MCLLDVLYKLNCDIIAVHLNHNWRGEESLQEAKVCENFCNQRNIKFYTETLSDDIPCTETCAREARYDFFKRCAEKFNSNVVFTAHNFDDNAETVLYRIIKGTGIKGLEGITEKREIFYRPLLKTTRCEIEKYCHKNKLEPNNDSSNKNTKYKRNLIRHKILPLLKEINPKVTYAINSLSDIVKEDNTQKSEIRELLVKNNIDYDKKKIDKIYDFINANKTSKSGKRMSLTTDLWLFVSNKETKVISKNIKSTNEIKITKEGDFQFEDFIFSIKKFKQEIKSYPKDCELTAYINTDNIDFTLRHRKDGDFIQPLGLKGTQKFKKYLNEKKIPNHQKDEIVLLCNCNEVLWAAGFGLSDKIKVTQYPTHVIKLRKADYEH